MAESHNIDASGEAQGVPGEQLTVLATPKVTAVSSSSISTTGKEPLAPTEDGDHPQGNKIRRQFEYWFSDDNLKRDSHLLTRCGGSLNVPVSLNEMMGWRSLRDLNHKRDRQLVITALNRSASLEVVNSGKNIRRRIPIEDALLTTDMKSHAAKVVMPAPAHLTKGMLKPTGFEEDACEYPIKPAEHAEEVELYDKDLSFSSRIEVAIQRYKNRRKLHQNLALVLNSFLEFGGVVCQPRPFGGGLSKEEMDEIDAATIAMLKAVHFVDSDRDDPDLWAVDFEGVAKAYLSDYYPMCIQKIPGIEGMELATRVLINFYNYILQHSVCPEYMSDILAARAVCTQANREIPAIQHLSELLPGAFNQACSYLFGGYYADILGENEWQTAEEIDKIAKADPHHAHALIQSVLTIMGGDAFTNISTQSILEGEDITDWASKFTCTKEENEDGWEIVHVEHPTKMHKKVFASQNLKPIGKLTLQRWVPPNTIQLDMPPPSLQEKYRPRGKEAKPHRIQLWMEQEVLEHCMVGLKLRCNLKYMVAPDVEGEGKVSGFWYLDYVSRVYASFHEALLNDLETKEVRVKWLEDHDDDDAVGGNDAGAIDEDAADDSD